LQHSGQSLGVSADGGAGIDVVIARVVAIRDRVDRCASSRRPDDHRAARDSRDAVCVISYTRRPRAPLAPRQLVRAERIAGELEVAARLRLRGAASATDGRERGKRRRTNERREGSG
jgi:hypothetical protein